MPRVCAVTGKKTRFGYNSPKSNKKTKRRFLTNLQTHTFTKDNGKSITLRVSRKGLRIINKKGIEAALSL